MSAEDGLVLTKIALVDGTVGDAFRTFSEGIGQWWPIEGHSISGGQAEEVVMEEGVGGRVFERTRDGAEILWGHVTVWDPPTRLAFSWHPGREEPTGQVIEVRFTSMHEGTRVEMEHRGRLEERKDGSIGRAGNIRSFAETVNARFEPVAPVDELVMTKVVTVNGPVEESFRIFAEEIGSWWPLELHTVSGSRAKTVVLEPKLGGRVFERTHEDEEIPWGRVTAWQPPMRIEMTWHPARDEPCGQTMEIRFTPTREGTRVEMEHRDSVKDRSSEKEAHDGDEGPLRAFIEAVNHAASTAG